MKKLWKNKEVRNLLGALGMVALLSLSLSYQLGYVSLPAWHFGSSVGASGVGTAGALAADTTPASDQDATDEAVCEQVRYQGSECLTTKDLREQREALVAAFHWVVANWFEFLSFVGLFVSAICSIVFFNRWRAARRKAKEALKKSNPSQVTVNGKVIQVPRMKCEQATMFLPGDPEFAGLTFDKVIGQDAAKEDILEILDFLQNPEKYLKMDARMPKGVIFYGPPGTGKTLLVRTLAALTNLPVLSISGSEFDEMFIGVGSSRVRNLFADYDALCQAFGGCIGFIDEFDGMARRREASGGSGQNEKDTTLTQFLKEMDGIKKRPGLIMIAATNRLDVLDEAATRPGRFDRKIEFFGPNRKDREAIIAINIAERLRADGLNFEQAAKGTPGASGAHMENIANEAKIMAARQNLDRITSLILDEAVQKVMHGARRDSQRKIMNGQELKTLNVHEGGHALTYWKRTGTAPLRYTVIPRGNSGGHVEFHEDFEFLKTREILETRLVVGMGGWAATLLECGGQEDTGPTSDFQVVTQEAIRMVTVYGMSKLGKINLQALKEAGLLSDEFKARVIVEVESLVNNAADEALRICHEHIEDLRTLVAAVEEHETLLGDDFERLCFPNRKPNSGTGTGASNGTGTGTGKSNDDGKVVPLKRLVPLPRQRIAALSLDGGSRLRLPEFLRKWPFGRREKSPEKATSR